MTRQVLAILAAAAFPPLSGAQDRPVLPPGPPPGPTAGTAALIDALFVQANMVEGGQVLFLVPLGEPDPKKVPEPSVLTKVDGKAIRAFGTDRKPLDSTELNKRLSVRTAAVVVHGQPPDAFFLKALSERGVVFVVPKKLFDRMAKAAAAEPLPGFWSVTKPGANGDTPTEDFWVIEAKKITLHPRGKPDGSMTYMWDASDYPKAIDLTPGQGPAKGKVLKGIYELDGNRLRICYVSPAAEQPEKAERPKEFGAPGTVTVVFGRVSP